MRDIRGQVLTDESFEGECMNLWVTGIKNSIEIPGNGNFEGKNNFFHIPEI